MQLQNLIGLSIILELTSFSKGQTWYVHVQKNIVAKMGSNVTINCKFDAPPEQKTNNITVYWKTNGTSKCSEKSNDKSAFIFHPDKTCVIPMYKGQTKLIGDKTKGNCSLVIEKLMDIHLKIYLRVAGFNDCYSFHTDSVTISMYNDTGSTSIPALQTFLMTTIEPMTTTSNNEIHNADLYLVIFIPLAALLIIVVTGIIIYAKHRRSQAFTREESGYYVNFSRASSNPPKSETSCKTLDTQHPEPKVIDEPVYINTQASTNPMSQSMDDINNVYANVDYSR